MCPFHPVAHVLSTVELAFDCCVVEGGGGDLGVEVHEGAIGPPDYIDGFY